jgi:hypothetical protein
VDQQKLEEFREAEALQIFSKADGVVALLGLLQLCAGDIRLLRAHRLLDGDQPLAHGLARPAGPRRQHEDGEADAQR